MHDDDPLWRVIVWVAVAASISFATAGLADQKDPRLPALFNRLKAAPNVAAALRGLQAMERRELPEALAAFDEMARRAPEFAEAWYKRATVNYLMRRFAESIADIDRTLALEPRHFAALSRLGLVYLALGREEKALEAFDRALAVHPNLDGADTRFRALREKLQGRKWKRSTPPGKATTGCCPV